MKLPSLKVLATHKEPSLACIFDKVFKQRLDKFELEVAEEKTRIIPFGRQVWRSGGKEHFYFLGLQNYLGTFKKGNGRCSTSLVKEYQ